MIKNRSANKGEWSELYAFFRMLDDGRVYAADENANKIDGKYVPIVSIARDWSEESTPEYFVGEKISIYQEDDIAKEILTHDVRLNSELLFSKIIQGSSELESGSFCIPDIEKFLDEMNIWKIKSPSKEKIDLKMTVKDSVLGENSILGFSLKSDMGSPPTLLNSGKNTRIRYKINGLSDKQIEEINNVKGKDYMMRKIEKLFLTTSEVLYDAYLSDVFKNNLILIDSKMPNILGEIVLTHYKNMKIYDCEDILKIISNYNPLGFPNTNAYQYKFNKLLVASALGMTPGKVWNGNESATGGYIIIKRNGEVLFYHISNRNIFEKYLMKNTRFDRPSASRHDYGYIYTIENCNYIDLNFQIRFKKIKK